MQTVDDLGADRDAVAGQQDYHFAAWEAVEEIPLPVLRVLAGVFIFEGIF